MVPRFRWHRRNSSTCASHRSFRHRPVPQPRYLPLKPIAADFCFLQPLVECDKPTAAKNAFASLSTVKTAVAAIATSELMSESGLQRLWRLLLRPWMVLWQPTRTHI